MHRQLLTLVILAAIGLSVVFVLPDHIEMKESAVKMDWPVKAGEWVMIRSGKPSPQEVAILAKDTDFSKAEYLHVPSNTPIEVGIVLSGMDPNNSIHRPERCLVAQGHGSLTREAVDLTMANGRALPAMRLRTRLDREIPTESGVPARITRNFVTYYWFVGNSRLTASHYQRTMMDITDRLLYGTNQRWAYITVAISLPDTPEARAMADDSSGKLDQILRNFLTTVIPSMIYFDRLDGRVP